MATVQGHTLGDRMPRKEDGRFIRGKGNYVDDVRLPGMLHSALLRSPYAHARINSVDTSAALELSGVHAVITGNDLAEQGLAWMPTLAGDTQAVLATDKVRFQGQEVAFVVADSTYIAQDALELIEVDYEPLDPVIDSRKALDEGAARHPRRQGRQGRQLHLLLGRGGQRGDGQGVRGGRGKGAPGDVLPAHPPRPDGDLRGRRRLRRLDRRDDHPLDLAGPARPQDALRHRLGAAGTPDPDNLPRHRRRLREQGPHLPWLRVRRRRLTRLGKARQVDGDAFGEPDELELRARLPHGRRARGHQRRQDPRRPLERSREPRGLRRPRPAGGAVSYGLLPHLHELLRRARRLRRGDRGIHQQGPGRHRLPLLVPGDGGHLPHGAHDGRARRRARDGPCGAQAQELRHEGADALRLRHGLGVRRRRLRGRLAGGFADRRLRGASGRAEAGP